MSTHGNTSRASSRDLEESTAPIACDLSAIPADRRAAHFELLRTLFVASEGRVREVDDGLQFELPPDSLTAVARFVDNERLCCPHLAFDLVVPPRGQRLALRVTGPGARDELLAHAPLASQPTHLP